MKLKEHGFYRLNAAQTKGLEGSGFVVAPGLSVSAFADSLRRSFTETICTPNSRGKPLKLADGLRKIREIFREAHHTGNKVIFIGNGGSAAIASHMATDYTKNGGIRSIAFNDAPTLTCMANDFGYPNVFAKQIEYYGVEGDVVVTISSSGTSRNILEAAAQAMTQGLRLITFSGFTDENPLRGMGDYNFFTPAGDYGLIEIAHLTLLHTITSLTRF